VVKSNQFNEDQDNFCRGWGQLLTQLFYPNAVRDTFGLATEVDIHPAIGPMLCLIVECFALLWPEDVSWDMTNPTPPPKGSVISIDDLLHSMKLRVAGEVNFKLRSSYYNLTI
jgi:hypothetical protein